MIFATILIFNTGIVLAEKTAFSDQEATVSAIKKVMPAVVSIVVSDLASTSILDMNTGQTSIENRKSQKGSGTGFLISADGLILTNKHVVEAGNVNTSEYKIIQNNGKNYFAKFIGNDPINDLAVLKITGKNLPTVELGDSSKLELGTTVIAIGNALGRYQNSVTKGIISGLGRNIQASDQSGHDEALDNVIQTDAQINPGNSGGPLIDLNGKVIGINVAIDQEGSSIGFALPVNDAKTVIQTVKKYGRIIRPRVGVRYTMLDSELSALNNLIRSTGAWIHTDDQNNPSVLPNSPAEKAGLQENDIIFEVDGKKVVGQNTFLSIIQKYKPGNKVGLKIQRDRKIIIKTLTLDEFKN